MKRTATISLLLLSTAGWLSADFRYEQTSRMTGGMMASAMKLAGAFSKQARQPMGSTVLVKGDRMAQVSNDRIQVIDLNSETITEINIEEKTYSSITFKQMAEAMQRAQERLAQQGQRSQGTDVRFKASVEETGETKQIGELSTRQVLMTLEMDGKDKESGQEGAVTVTSDMWMASDVAGYQEVRDFYMRLATKLAWTPGSSAMAMGRSEMTQGLSEISKEAAKLSGVPVLQIVSIGGQAGEGAAQSDQQSAREREEEESARSSVARSIGGRLGRLGGFGGFGRGNKSEPEKEEPQPEAAGGPAGSLMEMTIEMSGFSTSLIEDSRFEVPAGFRQVESETLKGLQ